MTMNAPVSLLGLGFGLDIMRSLLDVRAHRLDVLSGLFQQALLLADVHPSITSRRVRPCGRAYLHQTMPTQPGPEPEG